MITFNCYICDDELSMTTTEYSALGNPSGDDYLCNPCEDDVEMRAFGWVSGYDYEDYALASAGYGSDEDY
jgi:uncharacterized protein YlaI